MQVVYEGGMCCAHDSSNHNFAIRTVTRKQATLFGGVTCNVKRRLCCDIYKMAPPFFFRSGWFFFCLFASLTRLDVFEAPVWRSNEKD